MRHNRKRSVFHRTNDHRRSMIRNLATSLLLHGRIMTTARRAEVLAEYVEPLIHKALTCENRQHAIRYVNARVFGEAASIRLFDEIASQYKHKTGGYTRMVRTGNRAGDNAEQVVIELTCFAA